METFKDAFREALKQYYSHQKGRYKFFKTILPNFIKEKKIEGEQLTKLAMIALKYAQHGPDGLRYCLINYCNESNMNNEILLNELIKLRNCRPCYSIDEIFFKYNINYLEDHIIAQNDLKEITSFAISHKNLDKLNINKFEQKILKDGSFDNLYDYLSSVEQCNQKAVLTKILDIATPEELKEFSKREAERRETEKRVLNAYSAGYTDGSYYADGDFDLC